MEAVAQDFFSDSRAQLVKSLESQRRWNRLTLGAGLLFGACAILAMIGLGTWGAMQGDSPRDWVKDIALRGPAIVAVLVLVHMYVEIYRRGLSDMAEYQQRLREIEMMRVATLVSLSNGKRASPDRDYSALMATTIQAASPPSVVAPSLCAQKDSVVRIEDLARRLQDSPRARILVERSKVKWPNRVNLGQRE